MQNAKYCICYPLVSVAQIMDRNPLRTHIEEVCTIYTSSAVLHPRQVCNSLNMAHELGQLSPKATKAQMQAIINKYKI
ncbi:MAG: hypothetical protein ACK5JD_10965 [Mangrovibacterium sp.]